MFIFPGRRCTSELLCCSPQRSPFNIRITHVWFFIALRSGRCCFFSFFYLNVCLIQYATHPATRECCMFTMLTADILRACLRIRMEFIGFRRVNIWIVFSRISGIRFVFANVGRPAQSVCASERVNSVRTSPFGLAAGRNYEPEYALGTECVVCGLLQANGFIVFIFCLSCAHHLCRMRSTASNPRMLQAYNDGMCVRKTGTSTQ